jgi:hypothetical protein
MSTTFPQSTLSAEIVRPIRGLVTRRGYQRGRDAVVPRDSRAPGLWADNGEVGDQYVSGQCRWWHLQTASPELLEAESADALGAPGVVVDLGCGLGTVAFRRVELPSDTRKMPAVLAILTRPEHVPSDEFRHR